MVVGVHHAGYSRRAGCINRDCAHSFLDVGGEACGARVAAFDVSPEDDVAGSVAKHDLATKYVSEVFDCKGLSPQSGGWNVLRAEVAFRYNRSAGNVFGIAQHLHYAVSLCEARLHCRDF